jgi:arsenite methyltransferase
MSPWHFIARQLARPSGLFGRFVVGRMLNHANAEDNRLVFETLDPNPGGRILEIGFGGGALLFEIAGKLDGGHIDGVDISREMLAVASKKVARDALGESVSLHLAGVDALPFTNAKFDCAYSVHTIYFWPDLARGIAELARVIKPGGKLVLGFSSGEALVADGFTETGFKAYSSQQVSDICLAHGFEPELMNSIERKRGGRINAYRGIRIQ